MTLHKSPYQKYTEHFADGSSKDITDEIPFEIPENWAWCRLGEIINLLSGQDLNSKEYNDIQKGIPYITGASNFSKNKLEINRWTEFEKNIAKKGDILITCKGTIGEMTILEIDKVHIARQLMSINTIINNQKYILYFLTFKLKEIQQKANGLIPGINREDILLQIIPLPPLAEQRRIVEKIEELLALVDDLETNKTDLQSYIKQAKSKVLEMAVRGELVPQNPEDEPASVLLERIKNKQKSSKSKGKNTAHNTHYEEELPFNIPENWVWCRLGEVYDLLNGFAFKSNDYIEFSNTLVFRMSQIRPGGGIDFDNNPKYVSDEFATSKKEFLLKEGDVVIAMTDMATDTKILGIPTQIPYDKRNWLLNQRVGKLFQKEKNILDPTFLKNVLISDFMNKYYKTFGKGGVQINIGKQDILNAKIPLPPLAEQHRIVEKIEEIFSELEFIEEALI